MSAPKTTRHVGELRAFLPDYVSPEELKSPGCIGKLHLAEGDGKFWRDKGYLEVGVATVTLDVLVDDKHLVGMKVTSLREEMQRTRAEAEAKCTSILRQISQLEAIEYDGSVS